MRKGGNTQANNNNSKNAKKQIDPAQCKRLFTKFTKGKEVMSDDDLFEFFTKDLGLAGDDQQFGHIVTNVMCVKKIQQTNLDNFANFFKYVHGGSVGDLQLAIKQGKFTNQLKSAQTYKSMYKKIFELYSGKFTTLDLEVASALWQVYLKGKLKFYNQFLQYLQTLDEKTKVYKDSWNMMLDFSNEVKDLKDYKQEDGWPVLIDNFVEWMRKK